MWCTNQVQSQVLLQLPLSLSLKKDWDQTRGDSSHKYDNANCIEKIIYIDGALPFIISEIHNHVSSYRDNTPIRTMHYSYYMQLIFHFLNFTPTIELSHQQPNQFWPIKNPHKQKKYGVLKIPAYVCLIPA